MPPPRHDPEDERTATPFAGRWRLWRARHTNFRLRDFWWRLLDLLESSRAARVTLYLAASAVLVAGVLWFWVYPSWTKHNAIKIAREWLAAGQLRYAAEAAQQAAIAAPESPEPWQIAAELARRGGQMDKVLEYSRRAAELAPADPAILIAWASAALLADQPGEADTALDRLPIEELAASAHAQRLRGEIARRQLRLTTAKGYFESALKIEGPLAINEVPLGLILLNATDATERQRGLDLLAKWRTDRDWGATALRTLLADAVERNDLPMMARWAEALRTHPGCTVGDMPNCLLALSKADAPRFATVLARLETDHAVTPAAATQLLSWLNQIGQGPEAVRWMQTLPAAAMQRPPLAVAGAEALRITADWPALQAWTKDADWGPAADFLRWAYGLHAARMLGDEVRSDELWRTLYNHAQLDSVHALFAASTLYSWGRNKEAEALWWRAAGQEGKIATDALGSLARYYQVQRDAEGQYRVFRQLHLLQAQDRAIGNNLAFFAALTGRDQRLADQIARDNLAAEPDNPVYLATQAFVHYRQNRTPAALALLQPRADGADRSPALVFVYGLVLAATGHKPEAQALLGALPPESLTLAEVELIRQSLAN